MGCGPSEANACDERTHDTSGFVVVELVHPEQWSSQWSDQSPRCEAAGTSCVKCVRSLSGGMRVYQSVHLTYKLCI